VKNSPSDLQVLGVVWDVVMWLPSSSWSPHSPPNNTSNKFSFCVKGGLVIELCFWLFLNNGLGSFVGR